MIPYGRQTISGLDIEAVVEVLRSDYLTQGPVVPTFEKALASYCGVEYAVALNSATSALHVACLALDVGPGDCVWTTPITFVASANCALYCGARVDFVDIDPHTYNLSADRLEEKLARAEKSGFLPKVVIPVHLCGQSCDMKRIHELSRRYGFKIIEDASHAIGGRYAGEPIGSGRYSDITVFSFHPVKIITTGEGGAALTHDPVLAKRMALLRSHGITRDVADMESPPDGPWYYQQITLGFNYRMTDIQAALGLSQLRRLDDYVATRHKLAVRYDELLGRLPVRQPWRHPDSYSAFHLYVIRLKTESLGISHREVFESLRDAGIGVNLHYIPIYRQPYYSSPKFRAQDFPQAEQYYREALTLPLFPNLAEIEQDYVINTLENVLK